MKRQFFAFCFFLNSLISFGNAMLDDQPKEPAHIRKLDSDCPQKSDEIRSILQEFYPSESEKQLMIVYDGDLGILDSIKTEIATLCSGKHWDLPFLDFWDKPLDLTILEKIIYKNYRKTPEGNFHAMTRKNDLEPLIEMSATNVPGHDRPSVLWLRKELSKGKFFISTEENIPLLQEYLKSDSSQGCVAVIPSRKNRRAARLTRDSEFSAAERA